MAPPPNSASALSSKSSNKAPAAPRKPQQPADRHYGVITLFPEVMRPYLKASVLGRASREGRIGVELTQLRRFAKDRHRSVDDAPYGGGDGMVLRADVLKRAWEHARVRLERAPLATPSASPPVTLLLSPQGERLDATLARELSALPRVLLVCGHYEGVDERFIEQCVDRQISIGDFVLTGGEVPALALLDAVARFVPGVVGKQGSVAGDTFEQGGRLKYPQYTRPAEFEGLRVPSVLLSGDHQAIAQWREAESRARTQSWRAKRAGAERG